VGINNQVEQIYKLVSRSAFQQNQNAKAPYIFYLALNTLFAYLFYAEMLTDG
jgi:hypothetical protein